MTRTWHYIYSTAHFWALIFGIILVGHSSIAQTNKQLTELLNSEKEFAALSAEKSTRSAFLKYLADDAVLFKRGVVNGKQFWHEVPEGNDKLSWAPSYADISANGDFGYTTGPFKQYQSRTDANPAGVGHYVSVWQKLNGTWKILIDAGVSYPPTTVDSWDAQSGNSTGVSKLSATETRLAIVALENKFQEDFKQKGPLAFNNYLSEEARLYRPTKPPYYKTTIGELLAESDKKFKYESPLGIRVAPFGDMAFTYGNVGIEIERDGNSRKLNGNYLRIWKKENGNDWKIVVDMVSL